ncbi:hypothetical protein [Filifactor alocis]|uniref:hypothetical protein n=1 Tax=Filifactor alocis TaxID=143361 RepID=UPI003FA12195
MKTKLYLINADIHIDLMKKYEDDFIKNSVIKDFTEFTQYTSKEYRCEDKLSYIDKIRNRLHFDNFDDYVVDYIKGELDYQRDVGIFEDDKIEVEFGYEFAETVFNDSKRNFYKSGEKCVFYNNLVEIIKTVMEIE